MTRHREELAWAAGLFDGEGCAFLPTGKYPAPSLSIGQKDRLVLDRFKEAVGIGKVYGPYRRKGSSPIYTYRVGSFEEVQAVSAMIFQFLSPIKQHQIEAVFSNIKLEYR